MAADGQILLLIARFRFAAFVREGKEILLTVIDQHGDRKTIEGGTVYELMAKALVLPSAKTRICKGPCGQEKSIDCFPLRASGKDGRNDQCCQCATRRMVAYRERTRGSRTQATSSSNAASRSNV